MSDRAFGLILYASGLMYLVYGLVLVLNEFFAWWPVPPEDKFMRLYSLLGLLALAIGRLYLRGDRRQ